MHTLCKIQDYITVTIGSSLLRHLLCHAHTVQHQGFLNSHNTKFTTADICYTTQPLRNIHDYTTATIGSSLHMSKTTHALHFTYPTLHIPYSTHALWFTCTTIHMPCTTHALHFTYPTLHMAYATRALQYTFGTLHLPYNAHAQHNTYPTLHVAYTIHVPCYTWSTL